MRRYDRRTILFAILLAMLAGYVDAIGFLALGGFFVSFMSGNSTRLGVGLATGAWPAVATASGLIAAFVGGVMLGTAIGRNAAPRRRPAAVLALVCALLLLAGAKAGGSFAAMALLATAMGAENTIFERDSEVSIGLTYMTGTLVKLGQHLVSALTGGAAFGWVRFLLMWAGLVCGGIAGVRAHLAIGHAAIWIAAAAAGLLALGARLLRHEAG